MPGGRLTDDAGGWPMVVRLFVAGQTRWREVWGRVRADDGATAVEYAIMLAFVFLAVILAVAYLGQATNEPFENVRFE
jgi:Flp pilus assembly pilin Flp